MAKSFEELMDDPKLKEVYEKASLRADTYVEAIESMIYGQQYGFNVFNGERFYEALRCDYNLGPEEARTIMEKVRAETLDAIAKQDTHDA